MRCWLASAKAKVAWCPAGDVLYAGDEAQALAFFAGVLLPATLLPVLHATP